MQVGFTSTSFRQIKSVSKIVSIARAAGADCIEWGGDIHVKSLADARRVRALCDDAGINISSYGSYYRVGSGSECEWRKICEIAAAMGCGSVRVWLGDKDSEKTSAAEYEMLTADAKKICDEAKKYSLTVCPECHDKTYNNNTDAFLKIARDIDRDNFKTYFQSRYRRLDCDLDRIERTIPFIESVHISYSEQTREQNLKRDPLYIDKLLKKLNECRFDGNLLVEYTYLFSWAGMTKHMVKDIEKIRKKQEEFLCLQS
ncbi:MAG: sugar phosphate isomerase/epimerase [Clostridia bacterium]|nr:sugar phosphate isomerase/epimerase [Clostridia bacterium]